MINRFSSLALVALSALIGSAQSGNAASGGEIDQRVSNTLERFYGHVRGGEQLASKARAVLVFPSIVKAGFGVGGEYGEGELRIRGSNAGFYNSVSASIGFQLGVEERSVLIFFMTDSALDQFRNTKGWKVGVDGSVAILTVGAGGSIDSNKISSPVVGFILDPKGLMYNLTLEGSKISRIEKERFGVRVSRESLRVHLKVNEMLFHVNPSEGRLLQLASYFPIQNREKISPSTSSAPILPVRRPSAVPANRRSSARNSSGWE